MIDMVAWLYPRCKRGFKSFWKEGKEIEDVIDSPLPSSTHHDELITSTRAMGLRLDLSRTHLTSIYGTLTLPCDSILFHFPLTLVATCPPLEGISSITMYIKARENGSGCEGIDLIS